MDGCFGSIQSVRGARSRCRSRQCQPQEPHSGYRWGGCESSGRVLGIDPGRRRKVERVGGTSWRIARSRPSETSSTANRPREPTLLSVVYPMQSWRLHLKCAVGPTLQTGRSCASLRNFIRSLFHPADCRRHVSKTAERAEEIPNDASAVVPARCKLASELPDSGRDPMYRFEGSRVAKSLRLRRRDHTCIQG